jgi:hypothetical protein
VDVNVCSQVLSKHCEAGQAGQLPTANLVTPARAINGEQPSRHSLRSGFAVPGPFSRLFVASWTARPGVLTCFESCQRVQAGTWYLQQRFTSDSVCIYVVCRQTSRRDSPPAMHSVGINMQARQPVLLQQQHMRVAPTIARISTSTRTAAAAASSP